MAIEELELSIRLHTQVCVGPHATDLLISSVFTLISH